MPSLPTNDDHESRLDVADEDEALDAALEHLRRVVDARVGSTASFAEREAETLRLLEEKPKPT